MRCGLHVASFFLVFPLVWTAPAGIFVPDEVVVDLRQRRPSVDHVNRIGMDTSKHIFQLHGVNAAEIPVLRKKLRRRDMVPYFEKLASTEIAIEACGGKIIIGHDFFSRLGIR